MNNLSQGAHDCPVCGQPGKLMLAFPQKFHGHHFSLRTCSGCGLRYTFPDPSDELLNKIYSGDYWIRPKSVQDQGAIAGLVNKFNEFRLVLTIKPLLRKLQPGAFVLEVGCGSGQLASYLKRKGYSVEVTDISQDILDEIENIHGIAGYCGSLEDIHFSRAYDAIIFNNVLEHVPDPLQTLRRAVQLLSPRGLIFIEVPNIESFQFRVFRASWYHLAIPDHLVHFSPGCLQKIAQHSSLERIWYSTFSPRTSAAGYAASISPSLRPDKIRLSWSKSHLFLYLALQMFFLPVTLVEALAGKGSAIRAIYQKKS